VEVAEQKKRSRGECRRNSGEMRETPNRVIENGEITAFVRQTPALILSDVLIRDDLGSRYNVQFACGFEGFNEPPLICMVDRQQVVMDILAPI
jgi:hypothetical protein